ncbi:hypothetical protein HO133_004219 [Letharia lupina]|uniref:Uncharacterized protein n=1 Tax=Letharia lupina TaxID=560253 RepID=A0A8H6FJY5_9LECA|nr:uncharacterized protein HO133_004219 [Letharia lupina]KAF6229882.1 hypothetical protein HO133_004219 [Letharia lupina]
MDPMTILAGGRHQEKSGASSESDVLNATQNIPGKPPKTDTLLMTMRAPTVAHSTSSQVTEEPETFPRSHLRTLLLKYHTLDAILQMKPHVINRCMDLIHTEPPTGPMANK